MLPVYCKLHRVYMAGVIAEVTACIWQELLPASEGLLPAREELLGVAYLALWNT